MFNSIKSALKIKEVQKKLLFMLMIFIIIRIGTHLPIPGINKSMVTLWFSSTGNDALSLFNILSGGGISSASIFAVSITPYVTASIIIELLTILIPALKEMKENGEEGRKRKLRITKFLGIGLAVFQSVGTVLLFYRQGTFTDPSIVQMIAAVATMTAGSAFLMFLGDRLTENGYGNGTSFIIMANIVSNMPQMALTLYRQFISGQIISLAVLSWAIICFIFVIAIVAAIVLENAQREIPITSSNRVSTSHTGQQSTMPLKINMAGVIPIIFAQTVLSIPSMIQLMTGSSNEMLVKISNVCSSSYWFKLSHPLYTIGFAVQLLLIFFFAYYYTDISFSPKDTAQDLQKKGCMIPGIRPGKPTEQFLATLLKRLVFVGACGLVIVTSIPTLAICISGASISFGGTSLIIVTGVIIEIVKAMESDMSMRYHTGFLKGRKS